MPFRFNPITNRLDLIDIESIPPGTVATLTGNSGGAVPPTGNNINTIGTGSITIVGSPGTSTLTTQLTGLTNHNVLVGAGTSTIGLIVPSTSGFVLTSNGASLDPTFQASPGVGSITTITGNSGGPESPSAGNFNIVGTGSVTVAGTANTETVQLTGLTNHAVLVGAGTATITNVGPGATGTVLVGNTAADPSFSATPSIGGITVTGNSLFQAGTFTINSGTNAIAISGDAANTTLTLANGAGVKTVTLGSQTSTSSTLLQAGSGNFNITTANGDFTLNTGQGAIGISTDAPAFTVLNIGTGAGIKNLTLGSTVGNSITVLRAGSSGIGLQTTGTGVISIVSADGDITMNSGTGIISFSNDADDTVINIGTGAGQKDVLLGSTNTDSSLSLQYGTNGVTMTSGTGLTFLGTPDGEFTEPLQPAFLANLASNDDNVTGAGAFYFLGTNVPLTIIFDQGSNFNTNGTFTAPVDGKYTLGCSFLMGDLDIPMTAGRCFIPTSNRFFVVFTINPGVVRTDAGTAVFQGTVLVDMDAGDTAQCQIFIAGNLTDDADIQGQADNPLTWFSGNLEC